MARKVRNRQWHLHSRVEQYAARESAVGEILEGREAVLLRIIRALHARMQSRCQQATGKLGCSEEQLRININKCAQHAGQGAWHSLALGVQ